MSSTDMCTGIHPHLPHGGDKQTVIPTFLPSFCRHIPFIFRHVPFTAVVLFNHAFAPMLLVDFFFFAVLGFTKDSAEEGR